MPTYAYRCAACGHAFDIHQSFTDEALTTCEQCQGPLNKVYGSIGVTFKGSGFYRTDSRPKSTPGPTKSKEATKAPDSLKSTTSTSTASSKPTAPAKVG